MRFQETGAPACIPQNSRFLCTNDLGQKCKCIYTTNDSTWSFLSAWTNSPHKRGGYFSRRGEQVEEKGHPCSNGVKFEKRGNGSTIQRPLVLCTLRQKEEREKLPERRTVLIFLWAPLTSTLFVVRIGVNSSDVRFNASKSVGTEPLEKRIWETPVRGPVTFT